MFQRRLLGAGILCTLAISIASRAGAADARPDIIIIMADDMGFSDLGCYGSEITTPNLDRLASQGLRFTSFYNTSRCCPTRASLLTGLYSHQAGVGNMVGHTPYPGYLGYLNDRCVTIGEALGAAGYKTHFSGKWHVGEERPHWPGDRGFPEYFGLISGGSNYFRLDPTRKMAIDNVPWTPPEKYYVTDEISDRAAAYVRKETIQDKPYFLYVAYTAPHWPLHAYPEDIARYRGKYRGGWDALRLERHRRMIEMGLVDARWPLTPRDDQAPAWEDAKDQDDMDLRMSVYAAQIESMDRGIGRILEAVSAGGRADNTLIMFLADNGGCAEVVDRGKPGVPAGDPDSFLSYGRPWANASNTPFRLFKHWVHEGGISSPLIVRWPKVTGSWSAADRPALTGRDVGQRGVVTTPAGRLVREVGHVIDLMATCLDAAGAPYPTTFKGNEIIPLEGRSLVPLFRGQSREGHEAIFWEHEGGRAVRVGRWKLVAQHHGSWELFDLVEDRTEMNNLIDKEPDRAADLAARWDAWAKKVGVVDFSKIRKPSK